MSVHKRETLHGTWKSESVSCSVMSDSATSWNVCSPPGFSVPGVLQARILKRFPFPLPGHFPNTGIKPQSPVLQADCFPAEPPGKLWGIREIMQLVSFVTCFPWIRRVPRAPSQGSPQPLPDLASSSPWEKTMFKFWNHLLGLFSIIKWVPAWYPIFLWNEWKYKYFIGN